MMSKTIMLGGTDLDRLLLEWTRKIVVAIQDLITFFDTAMADVDEYLAMFPQELYILITAFYSMLIGVALVKTIGGLVR